MHPVPCSTVAPASAPAPESAAAPRPAPLTVLVVDDNPADRELHCVVVRALGLNVVAAANGWEGLVFARTLLPDLVLTDLRMPGLDGWALMNRLRAGPETASIPILLITGDAPELSPGLVRAAGATAMLAKPLDLPAFQSAVVTALLARGPAPALAR